METKKKDEKTTANGVTSTLRLDCPLCAGQGQVTGIGCPGFKPILLKCHNCNGTGKVDKDKLENGQRMKTDRLNRKMTLRDEAKRLGVTPIVLSGMENGAD